MTALPVSSTSEVLFDKQALERKIDELARGVASMIDDPAEAAIIGIRTRGATLARRIGEILLKERGWDLPLGLLDITLYRDDPSQLAAHPLVRKTEVEFDVENKMIALIDDVLYTGRTIRCALDEIIDFGRPRAIRLAVLIERNGREYPIQADFAAASIEAAPEQMVRVLLQEEDGRDEVVLTSEATVS